MFVLSRSTVTAYLYVCLLNIVTIVFLYNTRDFISYEETYEETKQRAVAWNVYVKTQTIGDNKFHAEWN